MSYTIDVRDHKTVRIYPADRYSGELTFNSLSEVTKELRSYGDVEDYIIFDAIKEYIQEYES